MNPCRRWLHKFSRIPDSKRNESERFFVFGREFSGDVRLGKLFCGIWAFFLSLLSYSGLTRISRDPRNALRLPEDDEKKYCHFRFWQGKPEDPRVKPGNAIRGRVNQGMTPGEMSGTIPNYCCCFLSLLSFPGLTGESRNLGVTRLV